MKQGIVWKNILIMMSVYFVLVIRLMTSAPAISNNICDYFLSRDFWNALITGGLTVLAGWLAFKATTDANRIAREIDERKLYVDMINAANIVRGYIAKMYQNLVELKSTSFSLQGKTIIDTLSDPSLTNSDCWIIYQILHNSVFENQETYSTMFPHLAILGEGCLNEYLRFAEAIKALQWTFDIDIGASNLQFPPSGNIVIALQVALKDIFLAQGRDNSPIETAENKAMETLEFFREKTRTYQNKYEKLTQGFTEA